MADQVVLKRYGIVITPLFEFAITLKKQSYASDDDIGGPIKGATHSLFPAQYFCYLQ